MAGEMRRTERPGGFTRCWRIDLPRHLGAGVAKGDDDRGIVNAGAPADHFLPFTRLKSTRLRPR